MVSVTEKTQAGQVGAAAEAAGMRAMAVEDGTALNGEPTARYLLSLAADATRSHALELSTTLDLDATPALQTGLRTYLADLAQRLHNPNPDYFLTLGGLPLSFGRFAWPSHGSTSGADTFVVHGEVRLETGDPSVLHAKVAAAMTQTFVEVIPAKEQPFAEGVIYNAVRKTMDQGQLELVKSGNRQPVPVTTRYYSTKQQRFIFNDTTDPQRSEFLAAKVYWLSGVLGKGEPVWLLDPLDAQYLNTTTAELAETVKALAGEGLIHLAANVAFATPTDALMGHEEQYAATIADALAFIKPSFNESMRSGQTNM